MPLGQTVTEQNVSCSGHLGAGLSVSQKGGKDQGQEAAVEHLVAGGRDAEVTLE